MNEAFKLPPGVGIDLLNDMERIVGRIKDGTLSAQQAATEVKALGARLPAAPTKRRGRPAGARTKADTPAVKRAREFLLLQIRDGLKPAQAARHVAATGTDVNNVYKEFDRHRERIASEVDLELEEAADRMLVEIFAALDGLVDRLLLATKGETDEATIRLLMREVVEIWCVELADGLNRASKTLADCYCRSRFSADMLNATA